MIVFTVAAVRAYAVGPLWIPATWETSDGVQMVGKYREPSQKGATTWVLLHGLGSSKAEWMPLAEKLATQGQGVLIYDARGHGESTRRGKEVLFYQDFHTGGPGSEWNRMVADVDSAIRWLKQNPQTGPIALGGASLGANIILVYASQHPEIKGLVLLSPGMEYAGIPTPKAYQKYAARPLFMAASPEDTYAFATVQQFARQRGDSTLRVRSGKGGEHGVHMVHGSFETDLLGWMKGI